MVCPWWIGYLLVSPLRRLVQDPRAILSPWVKDGMTVLEPGPGMGFFTLELARLVGPRGRVVAVDLQPRMLAGLTRRAGKAGLIERLETRQAPSRGLGVGDLAARVDFALAFAMVHEVEDQDLLFAELSAALKPGGALLLAEPAGHVREVDFAATLTRADRAGLHPASRPTIWRSHAAVLIKG